MDVRPPRLFDFSLLVVLAAFACGAGVAQAQDAVRLGTSSDEGHGWIVLPLQRDANSDDGADPDAVERAAPQPAAMLVHVAPRRYAGLPGAEPGVIRPARRLLAEPIATVAIGPRVYLFFPAIDGDSPAAGRVRVLSLTAAPSGLEGYWVFLPRTRLTSRPALPANAEFVRAFAHEGAIVAVVRQDDTEFPLVLSDAPGAVWEPPETDVPLTPATGMTSWDDDGEYRIPRMDVDGVRVSLDNAEIPTGVPLYAVEVPNPRPRLVVTWEIPTASTADDTFTPGPGSASGRYGAAEYALDTGTLLYAGPVQTGSPLASGDLRFIAAGLVVLMALGLALLLRPGPDAAVFALPGGVALAGLGARVTAAMIDVVLAVTLASSLTGVPIAALFGPEIFLLPTRGWTLLPATMLVGLAAGTLLEGMFGATPGKLLLGCRVTGPAEAGVPAGREGPIEPGAVIELRAIGLSRSLVRNAVKWVLPPIALLVLFDRSGRHRGDVLARAAVVERADETGSA